MSIVKKILTRLYRVFIHVYIHHFDKLVAIGAVSVFFKLARSYIFMIQSNNLKRCFHVIEISF